MADASAAIDGGRWPVTVAGGSETDPTSSPPSSRIRRVHRRQEKRIARSRDHRTTDPSTACRGRKQPADERPPDGGHCATDRTNTARRITEAAGGSGRDPGEADGRGRGAAGVAIPKRDRGEQSDQRGRTTRLVHGSLRPLRDAARRNEVPLLVARQLDGARQFGGGARGSGDAGDGGG